MKRNNIIYWFAVLLCLAVPAQSFATVYSGSCGENVNWSLDTETGLLEITGSGVMEGYNSHPTFFEEYRTYSPWYSLRDSITQCRIEEGITNIGRSAFWYCNRLTNINIPEGVTSIAECAFYSCSGLTSIIIPESVTSIGSCAFSCCSGLTNINIPEGVTSIGKAAFYCCYELTNITIPRDLSKITASVEPGTAAFERCKKLTSITWNAISFPDTYMSHWDTNLFSSDIREQITSFTFGKEVEKIPRYICYDMKNLTSITIPGSVTSIGYEAFRNCTGLTKVNISDLAAWCSISFEDFSNPLSKAHHLYLNGTEITDLVIPEGVTSIGSSAFEYCTGLTSVTIPNSVTSIGALAFYACTGLTSVKWNAISCISENNIFNYAKENITSFTFGDKVQTIPSYICSNMKNLTSITIPENVTSVGELAFSGCTRLSDLTWNAISCTTYNSNAFSNNNINSLIIGEEVETIPYEICKEMSNLTNITWNAISCLQTLGLFGTVKENITTFKFGDKVAIIPSNICNGMNKLTSITIPESVTNVKSSAFYGCNGLKEVTWNAISCDLENNVFNGTNENISSFTFGEKVETIPGNICNGMSKLSSIIIPEKVTSIGHSAFDGCSGLTNVTIGNNVKKIEKFTFSDCTSLNCIDIPDNVKSIDRAAFWGCTNLSNVTLGDGIESISDNSFYDCQALTDLVIGKNLKSIGQMAFSNCINLKNVTWNAISCTLSDYAFQLVEITSLTLGKDVEIIPELPMSKETSIVWNAVECSSTNLFSNVKKKIISFTFGEEIKTIPDYICSSMTNLSNVVISNSVTSIGKGAFIGCSNLTNVIIPNYVKNIGNSAFYGCSGLTNITIPESVTSIGERTFSGCSQMERVTCHANIAPSITSLTFNGISSKAVLYYPKGSDYSAWAPYFAQMVEMDYTGIDTPRADTGKNTTYDIYDMNGRMVRKAATTTDGLKAGLYIVNGKKVIVE